MTASPSASAFVAVAVTTAPVVGAAGASDTVAVGAVFATVRAAEVTGAEGAVPSSPVTRTVIASPFEPLPASERSSADAVSPGRSVPFLRHWYA